MPWRSKYKLGKTTSKQFEKLSDDQLFFQYKTFYSRYNPRNIEFSNKERHLITAKMRQNMKRTFRRGRARRVRRQAGQSYMKFSGSGGAAMAISPSLSSPIHRFERIVELNPIQASSTTIQFGLLTFSLQAVPQFAEFVNLYLQYCIEKVEVVFTPRNCQINSGAVASAASAPFLYTCYDPVGTENINTVSAIDQIRSTMKTVATTAQKRVLQPSPLLLLFNGAGNPGVSQCGRKWIAINAPEVPHLGLRYVLSLQGSAAAPAFSYDLSVKYHLAFKNSY